MNRVISEQLLMTVMNYLAERPYREVAQLIAALSACKPQESDKEEENK